MSTFKRISLLVILLAAVAGGFWILIPSAEWLFTMFLFGDFIAHSGSTGREADAAITKHLPVYIAIGATLIRVGMGLLIGILLTGVLSLLTPKLRRYWPLLLVGIALTLAIPVECTVAFHGTIFGYDSSLPLGP